ncbi:alginate lyase-domain-containing protein [Rhodocollybia butyracea]|uniref:Alginate lyase-domain-containing protein n=1 Tax=Rhodocollybia butyracea TaxID=206335 RepID=A0A9P5PLS3_9AGAR|nr:alginate lyase-domain-containing protein [Rhodocollybia butyracea]
MLSLFTACVLLAVDKALADPTDFVHPAYVIQHARDQDYSTSSAKASIVHNAQVAANKGPWSIINSNGVTAPSGDKHDYLSWAPYHWPNCNWCTSGSNHLVHSGDSGNDTDPQPDEPSPPDDLGPAEDTDGETYYLRARSVHDDVLLITSRHNRFRRVRRSVPPADSSSSSDVLSTPTSTIPPASESIIAEFPLPQAPLGSVPLLTSSLPTPSSHTTSTHFAGSSTAPQAAAKTKKASCTPSPTTSMAPSATWTTCPYVARDGKVNPDVRTLVGAGSINKGCDGFFSNALAFTFTGQPKYCEAAHNILNTLFLAEDTGMNSNVKFGQVVRGPGKDEGTFTGPLDLRGLVKIINGVLIFEASDNQCWTPDDAQEIRTWVTKYLDWLQTSLIGKKARSRPNNHGTFYCLVVALSQILLGNSQDALYTLDEFFDKTFQEQIAKSGEQPFEGVRTRPLHYRCFNLEALIALAKIGDYLGKNYWTRETKYGGTIEKAINFAMTVDPGNENVSELVPHVTAGMAAYGPSEAYDKFLSRQNYQDRPSWFYDQSSALTNAPTSQTKRSTVVWAREDGGVAGAIKPKCPDIFQTSEKVEIDNGIYCTCEQLLPLYETQTAVLA